MQNPNSGDGALRGMDTVENLADLFLLVQAIESGGFSSAAARLGTTRSLVSRRILALEERLGVRLLHRNARQFAVTAIGERVYQHAAAMREAAYAAQQAALSPGGAQHLIRVEAHALLSPMVASLLPEFAASHVLTRFAMTAGEGDIDRLLRQRTDIILSLRETVPDSTDIVARALGRLRFVTVTSPELLAHGEAPRHPSELDDHDCLTHGAEPSGYWRFRDVAPRRRNARMAFADVASLLAAVSGGLGFAQLPLYLVREALAAGTLVTVLDAFEPEPLALNALTATGRVASDAAVAFVRFLQLRLETSSQVTGFRARVTE